MCELERCYMGSILVTVDFMELRVRTRDDQRDYPDDIVIEKRGISVTACDLRRWGLQLHR